MSGKNGISKFDKALKTVQTQLKEENLSKILFDTKTNNLEQLKSIISDTNKDLKPAQKDFKSAFDTINELFIAKDKNNKKKIDIYIDKVNNLLVELQTIMDKTDSYNSFEERVKRENT